MHTSNDLLVHQREAVGRLVQLSAKWTPMRVPESRLSNLRVDPPLDCQSVVVANACAARFSLSFVVNGTAELEVDLAPAPLRLTERHGCGWDYVWLAWRQRAQIAERTRRACSPFHERLRSAKQDRARYFLKRHLSLLAWGQNIRYPAFRFPPLRRCLKL